MQLGLQWHSENHPEPAKQIMKSFLIFGKTARANNFFKQWLRILWVVEKVEKSIFGPVIQAIGGIEQELRFIILGQQLNKAGLDEFKLASEKL